MRFVTQILGSNPGLETIMTMNVLAALISKVGFISCYQIRGTQPLIYACHAYYFFLPFGAESVLQHQKKNDEMSV